MEEDLLTEEPPRRGERIPEKQGVFDKRDGPPPLERGRRIEELEGQDQGGRVGRRSDEFPGGASSIDDEAGAGADHEMLADHLPGYGGEDLPDCGIASAKDSLARCQTGPDGVGSLTRPSRVETAFP